MSFQTEYSCTRTHSVSLDVWFFFSRHELFWTAFLIKQIENVSCEYDRLNGWKSTLQSAWYNRHVRWTCLFYISFYQKMKNVSCEYDRLNGWNSTLQAAWCNRHVRWTCLFCISFIIWCLWTKPTIWLLILSFANFTEDRSRVFHILSSWRM